MKKSVGLIIPVYNEEKGIHLLLERLYKLVSKPELNSYEFEFIFINDGSKDQTYSLLKLAKSAETKNKFITILNLSRNFGKEAAVAAGIDYVKTDCAIILDADLQDPPELIPEMLKFWQDGFDDVYARRISRKGETWFKKWTSRNYYRFLKATTSIPIQVDTGDFRLLDRKCLNALKELRETGRNQKALFSWIGYKKKEIEYIRDARIVGETKWNYLKLVELALDGITSFTTAPLRIATVSGFFIAFGSFLYAIFTLIKNLFYYDGAHGYASMMIVILFLGGIQLLTIGVLGEYVGRIFNESKRRPIYLIEEIDENK